LILAVSDIVWQALIGGCVTITLAYMSARTALAVKAAADKAAADKVITDKEAKERDEATAKKVAEVAAQAAQAAEKVDNVKTTLESSTTETRTTLGEMKKVGEASHRLMNNKMLGRLRYEMDVTDRLANATGKPEDRREADVAKRLHEEHVEGQALLDSMMSDADQHGDQEKPHATG
jgi:hypothetical protein